MVDINKVSLEQREAAGKISCKLQPVAKQSILKQRHKDTEQKRFLDTLSKDVQNDKHIPTNVILNILYEDSDGKKVQTSNECTYVPIYAAKLAGYLTDDEFSKCGLKGHTKNKKGIFFGNLEKDLISSKNRHYSPRLTYVAMGIDENAIKHFFIVKKLDKSSFIKGIERSPDARFTDEHIEDNEYYTYMSIKDFAEIIKQHISK